MKKTMKPDTKVHENTRVRVVEVRTKRGRHLRASLWHSGVIGRFKTLHIDSSLDDEPVDDLGRQVALRLLAESWGIKIAIRGSK